MPRLIKTQVRDGVAELVLAREPLNVLNLAMMAEMAEFLVSLKGRDDLKILLLKAEGKAFSAGVDVGEHLGDMAPEMISSFHRVFRLIDELELVSVAQVQGAALGGGCELAVWADLVVASEKAKFGQPEILVGVLPPIAALVFPRIIGLKKAMELILTGETIPAAEAHRLGLVNHVVAPDQLETKTGELVEKLKGLSAVVLRLTRRAVLDGLHDDAGAGLRRIEAIYLDRLMKTHDAEEGLKAFLEKRPPIWKNR